MPRLAVRWAVLINAPVEQVFSYMRDPDNLFHGLAGGNPDFQFSDVKATPEGIGTTARVEVHLPGLKHLGPTGKVNIEITEVVPSRRIVVKSFMSKGRMFKFDGHSGVQWNGHQRIRGLGLVTSGLWVLPVILCR